MRYAAGFVLQAALLLGFWLVLSGQYTLLFIGMGVASSLLVTALTHDLVAHTLGPGRAQPRRLPTRAWRALTYGVWLLGRMVVASVQVAYIVCHPRMPLDPATLRFRTELRSPLARVVVANSITLIPGTMTVGLEGGEYTVHAFTPSAADDLVTGRLQNRVAALFLEPPQPPARPVWNPPRPEEQ